MPQPLDYSRPPPPPRNRYSVSGWIAALACLLLGFVVFPSQKGLGEWAPTLTFWACSIALILVRLLYDRGQR